MEIKLELISDSDNTYAKDDLIIKIGQDKIWVGLSGEDRKVAVDKEEFKKIMALL